MAGTDNLYDIGATAATRPRNIFVAGKYNNVTITQPATGSTLTIADGKTVQHDYNFTHTGADVSLVGSGSVAVDFPTSAGTLAITNKAWGDQTGSRAVNTTYTNASSTASMMVMVTLRFAITSGGGNAYAQAKSDASSPPTTVASGKVGIEAGLNGEDNSMQLTFIVAPGQKYRVDTTTTNGTATLGTWIEMPF
jgi:hypothetical protein